MHVGSEQAVNVGDTGSVRDIYLTIELLQDLQRKQILRDPFVIDDREDTEDVCRGAELMSQTRLKTNDAYGKRCQRLEEGSRYLC